MALLKINVHAGSRTRVTSMGGLYDAATLHAPVELAKWNTIHSIWQHIIASPAWSNGMFLASGARGLGLTPQSNPLDNNGCQFLYEKMSLSIYPIRKKSATRRICKSNILEGVVPRALASWILRLWTVLSVDLWNLLLSVNGVASKMRMPATVSADKKFRHRDSNPGRSGESQVS